MKTTYDAIERHNVTNWIVMIVQATKEDGTKNFYIEVASNFMGNRKPRNHIVYFDSWGQVTSPLHGVPIKVMDKARKLYTQVETLKAKERGE